MALTIVGVLIAQLFRLQHTERPDRELGYFVLGIPLAVVCIGCSMLVLALGTYRFWRQQNAMLRGKVHAGGWDINAVGGIFVLVCINYQIFSNPRLILEKVTLVILVLLVAVDVRKHQ